MPLSPRWTRPISYRVQCWIAWIGLAGFGLTGLLDWRTSGMVPPVNQVALALAVAWGIDLIRGRRTTPE